MSRRWIRNGACAATLALAAGCGGAAEPAKQAPSAESTPEAAQVSDAEAEALAAIEAEAAAIEAETESAPAASAGPSPSPADGGAPRAVTYRVSQDGLVVEVGAARFSPTAEAFRAGRGWGVEITVTATASAPGVVYWPARGPLALGGRVLRASGAVEPLADTREGGRDQALGPDAPLEFSRRWPEGAVAPLASGDVLELDLGLWGYGPDAASRRPVKRLARLRAKPGPKGVELTIEPPPQ
jgi:hypothetical protein